MSNPPSPKPKAKGKWDVHNLYNTLLYFTLSRKFLFAQEDRKNISRFDGWSTMEPGATVCIVTNRGAKSPLPTRLAAPIWSTIYPTFIAGFMKNKGRRSRQTVARWYRRQLLHGKFQNQCKTKSQKSIRMDYRRYAPFYHFGFASLSRVDPFNQSTDDHTLRHYCSGQVNQLKARPLRHTQATCQYRYRSGYHQIWWMEQNVQ